MVIIKQKPCTNHSGRNGYQPKAVVIHIMEGTLEGTDSWFAKTSSKVSAHYGVGKNGEIHQYVPETQAAWHAGRVARPAWKGLIPAGGGKWINPNFYTIGVEHEGNEQSEWTDAMYAASAALVRDICGRYGLPLDRNHVIGHHEIYAEKTCPGFKVDLNKIIALAAGDDAPPPPPHEPAKTPSPGTAATKSRLNIRSKPNMGVAPVATVPAGIALAYDGYTDEGEGVSGNSKWFYTPDGNWFWSGGVQ